MPEQLLDAGFHGLARARRARAFHPHGLWLAGELTTVADGPLPLEEGSSRPVAARLSKGAGVPGGGPDVLGLGVRIPPRDDLERPWDLALSSSGIGVVTRCLPLPARGWGRARYSSLLPYRVAGRTVWLLAVPHGDPVSPASLARLERWTRERPLRFALMAGPARGGWRPAARLVLHTVLPVPEAGRLSFDPVLNRPSGWTLAPDWLTEIRESAYRGSREGRRAPEKPERGRQAGPVDSPGWWAGR